MAGPNDDGPKPAQTGIDGLIVCVRSTYLARLSVCSYTCHSGGMAGLGRAAISANAAQTASEARMRGFFMAVLRRAWIWEDGTPGRWPPVTECGGLTREGGIRH